MAAVVCAPAALGRVDAAQKVGERPAPRASASADTTPPASRTRLLVRLRDDRGRAAVESRGGRLGRSIPGTRYRVVALGGSTSAPKVAARLRGARGIADVRLDHRRRAAAPPDDALLAKGRQFSFGPLRLEEAWQHADGSDQTVAVLDTGADLDHPELAGRLLPGRSFVETEPDVDDRNGHGTAVAGILAAATGNGRGIAGVAPEARVLPVKVLDEDGLGYDSEIAAGIAWAAGEGAGVINLSLGGSVPNPVIDDAVASARAKGAVVVASAGNDGLPEPTYPAASPGVIAVTATDQGGEFAWMSSYGDWVDIAAPGWRMVAPVAIDGPRESYEVLVGTSYSAPVVSGTAALVRSRHPGWSVREVEDRVLGTATDHGADGFDDRYGHGWVDPAAAVGAAARPAARLADGDGNWSPDTAQDVVYDGYGSIEQPGDVDWFEITSDRAQTALISVRGPNLESFEESYANDFDVAFDVYDAQLRPLDREDIWPENTTESGDVYLPTAGRYFIRVENMRGSRSPLLIRNPFSYSVNVEWRGADAPPPVLMTPNQYEAPYPVAGEAAGAAILDATGDGRADALITTEPPSAGNSRGGNVLLIAPQTTDGWLGSPVRMLMPADIGSKSAVGDIAGDDREDLLISAEGGWLLLEATAEGLATPRALPETAGWRAIEVHDWDGDGREDLIGTAGGAGGGVVALLRTDGGWNRTALHPGDVGPIALGDLDGDGRTDAATVAFDASERGRATVLRRLPGGGVQAVDVGPATGRAVIADVNGDGRVDLLTRHESGDFRDHGFDVRRQLPGGALSEPEWLGTFEPIDELVTGDVDGDGRTDVMTVSTLGLETYRQRADGTLATGQRESLPYASFYDWGGVAVGDITGDGTDDVVTANYNLGLVPSRGRSSSWPPPAWVRASTPRDHARQIASGAAPTVTFTRALEPASITSQTVRLTDASTGGEVAATREYAAATRTLTVRPAAPLVSGHAYRLRVTGVRDTQGRIMNERGGRARFDEELGFPLLLDGAPELPFTTTFTVGSPPADTAPPDTLITAGPQGVSDFSTFFVASSEQGGRFECATDTTDWAPCSQATSGGGDGVGQETFRVRAVDTAGNRDPTPAQRSFRLVPHSPRPANSYPGAAVAIDGHSGSLETQTVSRYDTPGFWLSPINPGGEVVWYEWRAPADGEVTFDTSGSSFDTVMAVQSSTLPGPPSQAGGPVVGDDDDDGDGRAARVTLEVGEDVTYWIAVGGFFESFHDGRGWWGHAAAGDLELSWRFSPDGPAPETQVTAGPPRHDRDVTATFEFAATDAAATFECRLDGGGFSACASPHDVTGLNDGEHRFEVRSTRAGVQDPTPAEYRWTVDTVAPAALIESGPPARTVERHAAFEIDSSEEGASLRCRFDGGAWEGCTRSLGYEVAGLQTGPHAFELVATDLAGNVSETARWEWTIEDRPPPPADDDPPATTLGEGPSGLVGSRHATFTFGADEEGTFVCGLDGADWTACTSPATYQGLADGRHTFRVRAVDLAGNADPTPLTREWTVDGTPPETSITAGPPAETRDTSASIAFATTESATFACRVDGGEWKACASPLELDGVAPGAHRVEVVAVDAVGNADGSPAAHGWTVLAPATEPEPGLDGGGPAGGDPAPPGGNDHAPSAGGDPASPAGDALPATLGLPTWLRGWLRARTARGLRRSGRAIPIRVTACPDQGDSRFADTPACRFAARTRLALHARGMKIATAARRVEPGRPATLRARLTRRGLELVRRPGAMRVRATLRIVTADGAVTRVAWRLRVR